jgi:hypothetical protein
MGNGFGGVLVGASGLVKQVIAARNGIDGIRTGDNSVVSESSAAENALNGIYCNTGALAVANVVALNGGSGIRIDYSGTMSNNVARLNTQYQLLLAAFGQDEVGLMTGNVAIGTSIDYPALGMLSSGQQYGFRANVVRAGGTPVSGGVDMGCNMRNATLTNCP